jgi:hypothetical protein
MKKPRHLKILIPSNPDAWKTIVLTTATWPPTLDVPQRAKVPPGSKSLLGRCTEDEEWDYQLLRGPGGRGYYLRVWRWDYKGSKFDEDPAAPAARLTPEEAYQFCVTNLLPQEVIQDFTRRLARHR